MSKVEEEDELPNEKIEEYDEDMDMDMDMDNAKDVFDKNG